MDNNKIKNTNDNKTTNKYQNEKENICSVNPNYKKTLDGRFERSNRVLRRGEEANQPLPEVEQNDTYKDNVSRGTNFINTTAFFEDSMDIKRLVDNIFNSRKLPDNIAHKLLKLREHKMRRGADDFTAIDLARILGSIPYYEKSQEVEDIEQVKRYLDSTHKGLDHVKEQIIEYLATERFNKKNNIESKPRVLCLVGSPGVGKTSIARSISNALNRKFEALPVAGREDTLWLTGNTQRYSGSHYGALVDMLIKLQISNPVILVDEIDKIPSTDGKGAKLQNLFLNLFDPSTNDKIRDEFLEEYIDYSNVLWICTANYWDRISEPLQSRMIKIQLDDYTLEQKLDILKDIIIPNNLKKFENSNYKVTL